MESFACHINVTLDSYTMISPEALWVMSVTPVGGFIIEMFNGKQKVKLLYS